MITPGRYDITIYTGSSFDLEVTLKDSEDTAVDLTDRVISASAWNDYMTAKYFDFVVTVVDAAKGSFRLSLSSETTSALPNTYGRIGTYDVLVEEPNGDKYYWLQGDVGVDVGVTRDG